MTVSIIAIAGAQGTGKTYLARGLTNKLNELGHQSEYISEMAREWISTFGPPEDVADQMDILNLQLNKENLLLKSKTNLEFIVVDSPIYLPYLYGSLIGDISKAKERYRLQKLFEIALENSLRYSYNIILRNSVYSQDDSLRIFTSETEDTLTNGVLFFTKAYNLRQVHIMDSTLNYDERVIEALNIVT